MKAHHPTRTSIPIVLMRAGTSKGVFIKESDMPFNRAEWPSILLSIMGSLDGDKRQLNGVGGGSSTTSKVAIVSASRQPGVDIEYTFVQVPVGKGQIDLSGNCGNIASGVGPFAVDEGMVEVPLGAEKIDVRVYNTNTKTLIVETIEVDSFGYFQPNGQHHIGGFQGTGSRIDVAFIDPAGSMTGSLLPSGKCVEILKVGIGSLPGKVDVRVSLVDAGNPVVLVDQASLPVYIQSLLPSSPEGLEFIELVRREGAVAFGLAKCTIEAAKTRGTPKIALLSRAPITSASSDQVDIQVTAYSMGTVHPSLQLTGAVCLGAASCLPCTVAADLLDTKQGGKTEYSHLRHISSVTDESLDRANHENFLRIQHLTGQIEVRTKAAIDHTGQVHIEYVKVTRTARRIFEGVALVDSVSIQE